MMAKNKAMSKLIKPDRTIDLKVPLNRYAKFLQEIVRKTAIMIAHWQAVGFCHGVMNTASIRLFGSLSRTICLF